MNEQPDQSLARFVETLRAQQQESWRRGDHVLVETLLEQHPDANSSDDTVLELLYAEFCLREQLGEAPAPDEYFRRFPDLRDRLGNLFEMHHAIESDELDSPVLSASDDTVEIADDASFGSMADPQTDQHDGEPVATQTARSFGDYEVLEEIARGGMGVVYKARQIQANRIVALKMILAGQFAASPYIERFQAEAEAAANLDHPNIVPIYDVGQHDGQHYFSMGYVDGQSLAQRIADGPLDCRDAAELLVPVADAVQYAHERGIIHRDLKPANVLLRRNLESRDQSPEQQDTVRPGSSSGHRRASLESHPMVTDFGLAKRLEVADGLTASGDIIGTPSYMPPEQASGQAAQISPAGDVYSLGAILYCLVSGHPPFQAASVLDTLDQVVQREPVPLRHLNAAIDRDIDTIALKCLQKEPAKRYGSAAELADELRRYLAGEPIHARPVGAVERTWRWCKRKPVVASLATIAALLAIAVVSLLAVGYRRETALRQDAELARTEAEDNSREAEKNWRLADENSRQAEKNWRLAEENSRLAERRALLAMKTLEAVVFDIQQKLTNVPAAHSIRTSLLTTAVDRLKEIARDLDTARRADLNLAVVHLELGDVFLTVGASGGLDGTIEAHRQYQRGNDILRELSKSRPDEWLVQQNLSISYDRLGDTLRRLGKLPKTREAYEEGLRVITAERDENPDNVIAQAGVAAAHSKLGEIAWAMGDVEEAIEAHTKGLDGFQLLAEAAPHRADYQRSMSVCYARLGEIMLWRGDKDSARDNYEKCLAIRKRLAERDSADADYRAQCDLSKAHRQLGDVTFGWNVPEAQDHYQKALEIAQQVLGSDPNNLAVQHCLSAAYGGLGEISLQAGDVSAARECFQKELELMISLAERSPADSMMQFELAVAYLHSGQASRQAGELPKAIASLQESLGVYQDLAKLSPNSKKIQQNLSTVYQQLGEAQLLTGDWLAALRHFEDKLAICNRVAELDDRATDAQLTLSIAHRRVGDTHLQLHRTTGDTDGYKKAIDHHLQSVAIVRRVADDHPSNSRIQYSLSTALEKMGDVRMGHELPLAREHFEECAEIRKKLVGTEYGTGSFRRTLFVAYDRLGTTAFLSEDYAAAHDFFSQGIEDARKMAQENPEDGQPQSDLIGAIFKAAHALQRGQEFASAAQLFQEGLEAFKRFEEQTGLDGWPYLKGYDQTFRKHIADCEFYEKVVNDIDFVLSQSKEEAIQYLGQRVPVLIARRRVADAAESAAKLAELDAENGGSLYNAACGFALCFAAVRQEAAADEPPDEQEVSAERYATRSVQLLEQVRSTGYFDDPENIDWLKEDPDFDSLRKRPDFKELVRSLESQEPAGDE